MSMLRYSSRLTASLIGTLLLIALASTAMTLNQMINPCPAEPDSTASYTDWWSMFLHDPSHTACSTSKAPNSNATCWISHLNAPIRSPPAISDGILYIVTSYHNLSDGNMYGCLYALNSSTGQHVWVRSLLGWVLTCDNSAPAVAHGMVYVTVDKTLHALNASTGEEKWSFTNSSGPTSAPTFSSVRDKVYLCSWKYVFALDALTGSQLWSFQTSGNWSNGPPAVKRFGGFSYDYLYLATCLNRSYFMFYILNGNSGYPLCSKTIQTYIFDAVTVGYGEVFAGDDSHLLALRDYSLEVDWCTGTYGAVSTPAIGYGLVYTCSDEARYVWEGGYVQAFDVYTGEKRWEYRTGGDRPFISDSAAIADGKVFVGGYDDNKIHALNALTGSLLWTYETGDRIESTPAVADGKLFVGSSDGNVYAFAYGEPPVHDIGVTKFAKDPLNKNVVCQNYTAHFNVTLENQGDFDELVNVSLYRNATKISTTTVSVGNMSTVAVRMVWNTSGVARYKTYNISVYAELVPGETDVSDNSASAGTAVVSYSGDVNADRRVDLKDVFAVNKAFGSRPGSANWKPNCDITDDKFVDLRDKFIVDSNYGYVEPP